MKQHKAAFVLLICFWVIAINCSKNELINGENKRENSGKINGVSFVASAKEIGKEEISIPKQKVAANFLSIMPYGFIPENGNEVIFDKDWQWWGEKTEGTTKTIQIAHELGYKVMLKPHVWKRHGEYTGDHHYRIEEDWTSFEKSYANYIKHYAQLAEELNVALFCIGTEWRMFVLSRPSFWIKLIKDIRSLYSGELAYAANWDEYSKVHFWKELDFVGIDAYFPLVEDETPGVVEIKKALLNYKKRLEVYTDSLNRKVLFTEFGYRSRDNNTLKPWESDRAGKANELAQLNAYSGFLDTFWKEDYIAGGFLWKWFHNHSEVGGEEHNGFTPQNKMAEKVILKTYSN